MQMQESLVKTYWWRLYKAITLIKQQKLTAYDFSNMKLGVAGIKILDREGIFTRLTKINLQRNNLGDDGASELSRILVLPGCTIEWLHLGFNQITSAGIDVLCQALKLNTSVTSFHLQENPIGDQGAIYLANLLLFNPRLLELHLNGKHYPTEDQIGIDGLAALTEVLTPNELHGYNATLQQLNLWGNRLGNDGMKYIKRILDTNPSISYLGLGRNNITAVGTQTLAEGLAGNNSLISLDIRDNPLGNKGLEHLADVIKRNSCLLSINIMACRVTQNAITYLLEKLSQHDCAAALFSVIIWHTDLSSVNRDSMFPIARTYLDWTMDFFSKIGFSGLYENIFVAGEYLSRQSRNVVDEERVRALRTKLFDNLTTFLAVQTIPKSMLASPEAFIRQFTTCAGLKGIRHIIAHALVFCNRDQLQQLLTEIVDKKNKVTNALRHELYNTREAYNQLLEKLEKANGSTADAVNKDDKELLEKTESLKRKFLQIKMILEEKIAELQAKDQFIELLRKRIEKPVSEKDSELAYEQLQDENSRLRKQTILDKNIIEALNKQINGYKAQGLPTQNIYDKVLSLIDAQKKPSTLSTLQHGSCVSTVIPVYYINLTQRLTALNAFGSDSSLIDNSQNPYYWYSIADGFRLLIGIRKQWLRYQISNETIYPVKALGEEFISTRENHHHIFIADPYITDNFAISLADDMATIMGTHIGDMANKNNRWQHMPTLLILPVLTGNHWRIIRVQIDYKARAVSILWDDPFGKEAFDSRLKKMFLNSLIENVKFLFKIQINADPLSIEQCEKMLDQQAAGNGWDCGVIAFSNVADYTNNQILNRQFAAAVARFVIFTIKSSKDENHSTVIQTTRRNHSLSCREIAGLLPQIERRLSIAQEILNSNQAKLELFQHSEVSHLTEEIYQFDDLTLSQFFEHLEVLRMNRKENRKANYDIEEIKTAFALAKVQMADRRRYQSGK